MTRLSSFLLLVAVMAMSVGAFQPMQSTSPRLSTVAVNSVSRKELLESAVKAATVSAVVMTTTSTAALADEYDDARNAARAKKGGGASLMAVPLVGGLALSLPFFLPSILRILGIKNDKMD